MKPRASLVFAGVGLSIAAILGVTAPKCGAQSVDFDGHPFVTNSAPRLQFQRKFVPSPTGIDYEFPEQTAHGVALLSRFPEFKLSDRRIHVDGPWYDTDAANLHFTRGIATIGAIPRYREQDDAPTNVRKLSPFQKWSLMIDPVWYAAAARLVKKLEQEAPANSHIPALRFLSEKHCYTNDRSAYLELGRYAFESERWPTDLRGEFVGYPAIDIETTEGWQHQRDCNGWLYQGMAEAAHKRGLSERAARREIHHIIGVDIQESHPGGFRSRLGQSKAAADVCQHQNHGAASEAPFSIVGLGTG